MATIDTPKTLNGVEITPYDNDVTLLYKWAYYFSIPIRLMVVRPRTESDLEIKSGTTVYVFESLPAIVQRLLLEKESLTNIYDIVTGLNKLITIDDIAMAYYSLLLQEGMRPDLYVTINKAYRDMDNTLTVDKFENMGDLQNTYLAWLNSQAERQDNDARRLQTILEIQEQLKEVDQEEKIPFSPVTMNSTIMSFSPNLEGKPVNPEDGLDIFNRSVVSRYVPYIKYNDKNGKPFFRVYTGEKTEAEPNYNVTIVPQTESIAKNTIYLTLWLGDPNSDGSVSLRDAPRESFFTVVYHLDNNYLAVESPVVGIGRRGLITDPQIAYNRTKAALPSLDFGEGKEIKVRGDFNIWGIDFEETSFLDMVLIQPLMNVYLYVEENIKPFALKKRLDVHYRSIYTDMTEGKTVTEEAYISNSASVSITLSQKVTVIEETVEVTDPITGVTTQAKLPTGIPYIHVNISQAESRTVVHEFIPIFQLLMRYYLDNRDEITGVYSSILPELNDLDALVNQRKKKQVQEEVVFELGKKAVTTTRKVNAKIRKLQEQAPDLFVLNYARRCQAPLQPIIVDPNEVATWKQRRVGNQERQVMPFPKDNPRWNFVCPDDSNSYPGVKLNTDLSNKDEFPYVPCCFKKDQMSPDKDSHYQDYVRNRAPVKRVGAEAEKEIITQKILKPEKVAKLPRAVENIIKRYSEDETNMRRFGVVNSPNSLLHCICVAIDDPSYIKLQDDIAKDDYVTRIRQHILATINPSLLKQEMYDYHDQEIYDLLANNEEFFDPALFFRAVEETFDINLYVFVPPPPGGDETELGALEIPRFKIFHARPLREERATILVMKSPSQETQDYPQCELICDYDKDNMTIVKVFGAEMTNICHDVLRQTLKTMMWNIKPDNSLIAYSNIFYELDHIELFQSEPISQYIDNNGKMRVLTINVNGQPMSIVTVPSQPENLPNTEILSRISHEIAVQMFGEPFSVTKDINGNVDGLWYRVLDIDNGEYVPIIPVNKFLDKPDGPPNPIQVSGFSVTERLSRLRRTLSIIKQILRWLFELARSKQDIDAATFASLYMVMDQTPVADSSVYYDLSKVSRRLPLVETVQDAIRVMTPVIPSLFNKGKIVMYDAIFADRMIKMLRDYANLKYGMAIKIPESIEGFYESEDDFLKSNDDKVFTNLKDLTAWLNSLKSSQNYSKYFNVRNKIEIAMGFNTDPFLYRDEDGRIFIVQNVVGGTKAKAITVASTWENPEYRVNIGPEPEPMQEVPPHMIFAITPSSILVPIEDNTDGQEEFLKLVYYGSPGDKMVGKEARYGALLEIL